LIEANHLILARPNYISIIQLSIWYLSSI
jgi:hypothetical protein